MALRLVPENTNIDFVGKRFIAFAVTGLLLLATFASLGVRGLNYGIDFVGGILIEAHAEQPVDIGALRSQLGQLDLGSVELQQFGGPEEILIKVQQQEGGERAQVAAVERIKETLGPGYEYRRVEQVGPKVGSELLRSGIIATVLAVAAITAYVAIRFEWQFGIAALVATFHDVVLTIGLYSVLGLEFNLTAIAALLTLAGYSINDTVVVFDRMRENMRKYRQADLKTLINKSVNQTLARTVLTSGSTLLAILPLLIFGGNTLAPFTVAMTFGIFIGTFSSVYVAAGLLMYLPPLRRGRAEERPAEQAEGAPSAP